MNEIRVGGLALLSLVLIGPAAYAQTPYQVADINTAAVQISRDPSDLTATTSGLYFLGYQGGHGREIFRLDAGGAISLPIDLVPGNGCCEIDGLVAAGDLLFFSWKEFLYRTDGTNAGTFAVHQFGAGFNPIQETAAVGNGLFFKVVHNGEDELWHSDGTVAGTGPLVTMEADELTGAGGRLYFASSDADGREPWTSDGTVAGTRKLKDVCPGPCPGLSVFPGFTEVAGTVYFVASDGTQGGIWTTDGTEAGTQRVPGDQGAGANHLTAAGSLLLYTAANQRELWRTDGTATGGARLWTGDRVLRVEGESGKGFFVARQPATGEELWVTDGTQAGTAIVVDACPGPCDSFLFQETFGAVPGVLLYLHDGQLWRSDGTAAGTFALATFDLAYPAFARFGGHTYLSALTNGPGNELWRTDGTLAGTTVVNDLVDVGSGPYLLTSAGDGLFFSAYRADVGFDAWSTLGTAASTRPVDLVPGPAELLPFAYVPLGDAALVLASNQGPKNLWITDGVTGGGQLLTSQATGFEVVTANGRAFFAGGPSDAESEPWVTDGTPGGTGPLGDLVTGPLGSHPTNFVAYRGRAYFRTVSGRVWSSDGTAAGTQIAIDRDCSPLAPVGTQLFLFCFDPAIGYELWVGDGTTAGTHLVKDITPGAASTFGRTPAVVDGLLYFMAEGPASGRELWRSDGTEAGTFLVRDIAPGAAESNPRTFTALDGRLYFIATAPDSGTELWRTDGTEAGTALVRDINPGPGSGAFAVAAAGGRLVVSAYTTAAGIELWTSDGTTAGTSPLPEIAPGPWSGVAGFPLGVLGRTVYANASDGATGAELWAVDLPAGAVRVDDAQVTEGDTGTLDAVFAIRLDSPSTAPVAVAYTTVAGTAQAGSDFLPRSGVLTFAPGATALEVFVPIVGDLADEAEESFGLELSPVGGTVFSDRRGTAALIDDDGPTLAIAGTSVVEGNTGSTAATFTVTLTTADGSPTPDAKTIGYETVSGTANSGTDFLAASGVLSFPAATTSGSTRTVDVAVLGDSIDEADEAFGLRIASPGDASAAGQASGAVIVDDDGVTAGAPVEVAHGARLIATLAPAVGRTSDLDFYVLRQQPFASYEVAVDETSGDSIPLGLERVAVDGSSVLQSAVPTGTGGALSLRWINVFSTAVDHQQLRVGSQTCGSTCATDDRYRLRVYETTLAAPRVNNTGGQGTVLLLQNTTGNLLNVLVSYWRPNGTIGAQQSLQIHGHGVAGVQTSTAFPASSGTATVAHDAPYGTLVGKVVSLEPATGFSFDTPLTSRPR